MEGLQRLFIYTNYCVDSDIQALVCRDFWTGVYIAAFAVTIMIVALIARTMFREYWEFRRNRLRLEARAVVAEPEVMERAKWKEQEIPQSHGEIASAIRRALEARKAVSQ
jgi:hypothetical protein